jgi:hypothetical protein
MAGSHMVDSKTFDAVSGRRTMSIPTPVPM